MRKQFFVILLSAIIICVTLMLISTIAFGQEINAAGKKSLFIGDSHTAYNKGWQEQVCKKTGMICVNTAVGGKRTSWMLNVARQRINSSYDYCFIWGGANDMASMVKVSDAVKNVQEIVNICIANGVKPIVLTGFDPPACIDTRGKGKEWNNYVERYTLFQQGLQTRITGATLVVNHYVTRSEGDCGDFICHMSASGHRKMANGVIKACGFQTFSK